MSQTATITSTGKSNVLALVAIIKAMDIKITGWERTSNWGRPQVTVTLDVAGLSIAQARALDGLAA